MRMLIFAVTVLAVSTAHAGFGVCGDPAAGNCCAANETPGCDDTECCQTVCAVDPYCCVVLWDVICADEANDLCDCTAGACCLSDGSCTDAHSQAECNEFGGAFQGVLTSCDEITCVPCVTGVIAVPEDVLTIQGAIDVACSGAQIIVAPGIYFETINFLGRAVTLRSADGPEVTIIDGTGNLHVVRCVNGEGPDAVLDGFTITGGNANGVDFPNEHGGGMLNVTSSSPTVANCTFSANTAFKGGGMYNAGGSHPKVINCTFSQNSADFGGGMFNSNGNPMVANCTFSQNSAGAGGGMFNDASSPSVTGCTFSDNVAGWTGGGMLNAPNSSPTVIDCTFSGNSSEAFGGGMTNGFGYATIIGCAFIGNMSRRGGGIHNENSNPTVIDCTFSGNSAEAYGGGMTNMQSGSPTVTRCLFDGNTASDGGGGMYNQVSSPTVTDCTFFENAIVDEGDGGGMFNGGSSPTVTNCAFIGNTAFDDGGGMANILANPTVTNCTFIDSATRGDGGGMVNLIDSSPTVTNCTFSGNSAGSNGDGIANIFDSNPVVTNCIFRSGGDEIWNLDSAPTIRYSAVEGGWPGTGNIDADPLFVDPDNGDYRLLPGSPCIDTGDNTAVPKGVVRDLDGNPRFVADACAGDIGAAVDMGAYEFQGTSCDLSNVMAMLAVWSRCSDCGTCPADFDGACAVGILDLLVLLGRGG